MQTIASETATTTSGSAAPAHFEAVIAYQDFQTGTRAKRAIDHIARETHQEGAFSQTMWKFDVLRMPKLREMAAEEAAAADVIVVSAHGDEGIPESICKWVERWVARRSGRPGGVVLLLDRLDGVFEGSSGMRSYFRRMAEQAGLDYFEHGDRGSTSNISSDGGDNQAACPPRFLRESGAVSVIEPNGSTRILEAF